MDNTRILPSGILALAGYSGDFARNFLEERRWLYKHQYYNSNLRAVERIAHAVILQWLLWKTSSQLGSNYFDKSKIEQYSNLTLNRELLGDTRSEKGRLARTLLWDKLRELAYREKSVSEQSNQQGEAELLILLAEEIRDNRKGVLNEWAEQCITVLKRILIPSASRGAGILSISEYLTSNVGISFSDSCYVRFSQLKEVREIARYLELSRPFHAIFDIAVMPRVLSYPPSRRIKCKHGTILQDCIAVSHRDPDRWGIQTNSWIPLSKSSIADLDAEDRRWGKVMTVSPKADDPEVWHAMDAFRARCRDRGIELQDGDPDAR